LLPCLSADLLLVLSWLRGALSVPLSSEDTEH
jgi:hypothetical protein